jgi:hypothetical protein
MFAQTVSTGTGLLALGGVGGLIAVIKKGHDFSKQVANRQWGAVVSQVLAWAIGVLVVVVWARSRIYGATVALGDGTLHDADWWSLVVIGIAVSSGGGIVSDVIKAKDNTQSAAVPPLVPPADPTPPAYLPPEPTAVSAADVTTAADSPIVVPGSDGTPVDVPLDEGGDTDVETPEEAALAAATPPPVVDLTVEPSNMGLLG